MTTVGLTALEAIRCFAKTLRRGLLCFHLRHVRLLIFFSPVHKRYKGSRDPPSSAATGGTTDFLRSAAHFFLGPKTMIICLPSISGFCSTTEYGARSSEIRVKRRRPMS